MIGCEMACDRPGKRKGRRNNMAYGFYGWDHGDIGEVTDEYERSWTPCQLYDALWDIWCEYTCAPRLRGQWSEENRTVGQCSITAFLAQDIFGGKVYGILRPGGNYHCYNVVGDCVFDLTSQQFGDEVLDYENNPEQFREAHFAKEEKRQRYQFLKGELERRFGRKMVSVSEIMRKMILEARGNLHDINHFLKVHSYAKLIGEYEGLCARELRTLEIGAILHDIACPLCREKYGNTNGKRQEEEGMPLVRKFFEGKNLERDILERVVFLVGHHHTLTDIRGLDYQILVEADYLVNAGEGSYSEENIRGMLAGTFRTKTGKELLEGIYLGKEGALPY